MLPCTLRGVGVKAGLQPGSNYRVALVLVGASATLAALGIRRCSWFLGNAALLSRVVVSSCHDQRLRMQLPALL